MPTEPREPIKPITTKMDKRSPFYDENSNDIPPLARLTIKRTEVIQSTCKSDDEYKREAFNATSISEDEEYKDRSKKYIPPPSTTKKFTHKNLSPKYNVLIFD